MAVKLVDKNASDFICLSTDTKPTTDGAGQVLPPGTSILELDTHKTYIFDGISAWY